MPAFVKLLKDTEAEVRTAISGQIPGNILLLYDSMSHFSDNPSFRFLFSS